MICNWLKNYSIELIVLKGLLNGNDVNYECFLHELLEEIFETKKDGING
jgi:hypothetical protein